MRATPAGADTQRLLFPLLGWLSILVLGWVAWTGVPRLTGPLAMLTAERVLLVELMPDKAVVFPVRAQTRRLRLSSAMVLQPPVEDRGRTSWIYGFEVLAKDEHGNTLRRWPLWLRTRESRTGDAVDGQASSLLLENDRIATDLQDLFVDFDDLEGVTQIHMRTISDDRVVIRGWEEMPRLPGEVQQLHHALPFPMQQASAANTTALPWQVLSLREQDSDLLSRWQRLAPVGVEGRDFEMLSLRITDYRESWEEATFDENPLRPGQAVAWNLRGPARLRLRGPEDMTVRCVVLPFDVEEDTADPVFESCGSPSEGLWSIEAAPDTIVSVHAFRPDDAEGTVPVFTKVEQLDPRQIAVWGHPNTTRLAEGGMLLAPDVAGLPMWRTGPELLPVEAVVTGPNVLRVTARFPVGLPSESAGATVAIEERDEAGKVLRRSEMPMSAPASRYERYRQAPNHLAWPSEPTSMWIRMLPETRSITAQADSLADLALAIYDPPDAPPRHLAGFTELPPLHVRAGYVPYDMDAWATIWPSNLDPLTAAEQTTRVDAIIRIEPWGEDERRRISRREGDAEGVAHEYTLEPITRPLERALAEDPRDATRAFGAGDRTALPASIRAPARGTVLTWQVPVDQIGQEARVFADGLELRRFPVVVPAGRISLDDLAPGQHNLRVEAPGRWWVNAPGSGGRETVRRVWSFSQPMDVRIVTEPGDSAVVHAFLYGNLSRSMISWAIDGGSPAFIPAAFASFSRPSSILELLTRPEKARWMDEVGSQVGTLGAVRVPVEPDLAPGPHTIRFEVVEGRNLWVRFTSTHGRGSSRNTWINWQEQSP
ncbi:MAG TPA: hypothetical protein PKY30_01485 [Myxococcota bacterium]|nr:hypothetical protein [Myxococcota bacterium]